MKFDAIRSESSVLNVFPFNSEKKRGGAAVRLVILMHSPLCSVIMSVLHVLKANKCNSSLTKSFGVQICQLIFCYCIGSHNLLINKLIANPTIIHFTEMDLDFI